MLITDNQGPRQLKTDTRQWNSGRVKFAVVGWKDKPEKNYIVFEKNFFGISKNKDQKFNLLNKDWDRLKQLIDGELATTTGWIIPNSIINKNELDSLVEKDPNILSRILSSKNLFKLSESSLESLDELIIKVYDVKKDKIDLILKKLSETSVTEIEKFGSLLEDLKLNQVSMMASLVYQKIKIIELLESLVISRESSEKDIHKVFESNPWLIGNRYEIVKSEKTLSDYLNISLKEDVEMGKRPDIIARIIPHTNDVVLVEFKSAQVKLKAKHIGQILEYKSLIHKYRPNTKIIHSFLFGYEKDDTFIDSNDVEIKTFSEIISERRSEYQSYQDILELGKEVNSEYN